MTTNTNAIVLAAGKGTRMHSNLPKVLHCAAGRPLIKIVLDELRSSGIGKFRVVVGYGADSVKSCLQGVKGVEFFEQKKQLGTAHAVQQANPETLSGSVLICNGDMPLITGLDYSSALKFFEDGNFDLCVLTALTKNPKGLGRIMRDESGQITGIIEEKDATETQKKIREVNSGAYFVKANLLKDLLPKIGSSNHQKEFYFTDIVRLSLDSGKKVQGFLGKNGGLSAGVNTQEELAAAGKRLYARKARELMAKGIAIVDPGHTYIESTVEIGAETIIEPGTFIRGATKIGTNCRVEAHCLITDSMISDNVEIRWGSIVQSSRVEENALIGPYARIRPESLIGKGAHVGNFVELKKTTLGAGAKANHLTYLGDAEIGEGTNIGCGTITCNYAIDRKKYKTKIGKNVFVGSDVQFVAPVEIEDGVVIASGSTITKHVPKDSLAFARTKQVNKDGYYKKGKK